MKGGREEKEGGWKWEGREREGRAREGGRWREGARESRKEGSGGREGGRVGRPFAGLGMRQSCF